ncbi:uncharacterized protein L3040_000295 [Drepanopeziza brunnea f. sp. 'multigermtubi']|uniref:uncharacterized protein n=1 Tax=Drepanopeziza brunnea f. sp. 'multigermtubi' TaxID=698441 RepID=UPI0023A26646|nr:hypothetical protein L3040_000295 [Drepanopeziza brunnea f. sp. 'multigermtubi']
MPPLILHNVPEDELFTGDDGVTRPYGMYYPGAMADQIPILPGFFDPNNEFFSNDGNPTVSRVRRTVPETGSFGKSTRRSRSRTGTPAAKREDPTLVAADAIFSQFFAQKATELPELPQRKTSLSASISQPNLSSGAPLAQIDGNAGPSRFSKKEPHKEPTEVILRGFDSTQQYAVIREYENLAGRICEDYPRDAPIEQRRYKTDLRDQASLRRKPLTMEEKAKALKFAGGEHWIKVTFESAEAAEIAVESSPQNIMGHLVYAELYRGVPPTSDEPVTITGGGNSRTPGGSRYQAQSLGTTSGFNASSARRPFSNLPLSQTALEMREVSSSSSTGSHTSSQTMDTGTIASSFSSGTVIGQLASDQETGDLLYCRKIPTAKRMQLLPAENAYLPQQSMTKKVVSSIPLIGWLTEDIFGSVIPRTDQGEFDWARANFYWRVIFFLNFFDWMGIEKENQE